MAQGAGVLKGKPAVAKFPEGLRGMGLQTTRWVQLTKGVEYYYGSFTNLLGTLDGYKGGPQGYGTYSVSHDRVAVVTVRVPAPAES